MTTSITFDDIASLVMESLEAFRATLPEGDLPDDLDLETILFGEDGVLDSLGIVNVVVLTERRIEDRYGVSVSLADEDALAAVDNPFHTVRTFVDFVHSLVESALEGERTASGTG